MGFDMAAKARECLLEGPPRAFPPETIRKAVSHLAGLSVTVQGITTTASTGRMINNRQVFERQMGNLNPDSWMEEE